MMVCLLTSSAITHLNFIKFSVHVACDHGSVVLWQQCDTLCTSAFVVGATFAYNWLDKSGTQSDSPGTAWRFTPSCIVKLTSQAAALDQSGV